MDDELHDMPKRGFCGIFLGFVAIFIITPLFIKDFAGVLSTQVGLGLILLSTLYLLRALPRLLLIGSFLVGCFAVFCGLALWHNSLYFMAAAYIFYSIFLLFTMALLAKRVLLKKHVDTNLLFGVATVYILAGILFGKLYYLQDFFIPDSFTGIPPMVLGTHNIAAGTENQFNFLYYSFTTLSTLGLGDIAPKHHLARTLTVIEAVFGQLYIATIVAKMVSVWRSSSTTRE